MQHRKFQKIISHFSEIPKNFRDILSSFLRVCFRLKNMCSINFVGEKSSTTTTTNTKHYFNEVKEEHREKKYFRRTTKNENALLPFLSIFFLFHFFFTLLTYKHTLYQWKRYFFRFGLGSRFRVSISSYAFQWWKNQLRIGENAYAFQNIFFMLFFKCCEGEFFLGFWKSWDNFQV